MTKVHPHFSIFAIALPLLLALPLQCRSAHEDEAEIPESLIESAVFVEHHLQAQKIRRVNQAKIEREAAEAVSEAENALAALHSGKIQEALLDLQAAVSKLRHLQSKNSDLKFVPVSFQEEAFLFEGSLRDVQTTARKANQLIHEHRIQDARQLLDQLASEIRIHIVSLPLNEYSSDLERVISLIRADQKAQAQTALRDTLDSLVSNVEIYPLPVLAAESDLNEAIALQRKFGAAMQQTEKDEILGLAGKAEGQLKLAEALGYGDKSDYEALYQDIRSLRDNLQTSKVKAAWKKLRATLGHLKNKILQHGKEAPRIDHDPH